MPERENRWFVYILQCRNGTLYTGITTDLDRRFRDHANRAAKYTAYNPPVKYLYNEPHPDRASASRREHAIKKLSRARKLELCGSPTPLRPPKRRRKAVLKKSD